MFPLIRLIAFSVILLAAILVSTTSSAKLPVNSDFASATTKTKEANAFVDRLVDDVEEKIRDQFDPAELPEGGFGFEKKILLITVKGEMKFYEGWLVGLSTLHRVGTSRLTKVDNGERKTVDVSSTLGIDGLVGHYKAHAKFMNLGPSFEVTLSVPEVTVDIAVQQQLHMDGSRPVLTHFDILNVGKVDVKVKGSLGLLNWTVNKIVTFMANVVKNFVVRQLESPIRKLISEQLTNGTITLEGV